jgi:hypothetical protein
MVFPSRRPPAETAARFMDAAAEKAALEADESTDVGRIAVPGGEEMRLRLGLLRMGEGPFLYDFRWTVAVRRTARPDGRVTLSYALDEAAPRERVSLFRGFATIEPSGSGSLVREVLVVGSPVSPPFFLKAKVRNAVERILVKRWTRLAQ